MRRYLCILLSLLMAFSTALSCTAETRETVIAREGMEETVTETLFESTDGYSVWYADEWLEAYEGEMGNMEGVIVCSKYVPDDGMIISEITEEDAVEYTEDFDEDIVELSHTSRVVMDIYREQEDGRILFLSLVAENGRYVSVVGEYSLEAAEGTGRLLQNAMESITFGPGVPVSVEWGDDGEMAEDSAATVILTPQKSLTEFRVLSIEWTDMPADGMPEYSAETVFSWDEVQAGEPVTVTLEFIGEMPNNGISYRDEDGYHDFALDISGYDGSLYLWSLNEDYDG